MGVFEVASFEAGTKTMMKNIVAATEASCLFHETYISVLSSPSLLAHTDVAVMPDNEADEKVVLPVAFIASCKFGEDGEMGTAAVDVGIPEGSMGLDCGPETIKLNAATIAANKTIIWNGCI